MQLNRLTDIAAMASRLPESDRDLLVGQINGVLETLGRLDLRGILDRQGFGDSAFSRLRKRMKDALAGGKAKRKVRRPAEETDGE